MLSASLVLADTVPARPARQSSQQLSRHPFRVWHDHFCRALRVATPDALFSKNNEVGIPIFTSGGVRTISHCSRFTFGLVLDKIRLLKYNTRRKEAENAKGTRLVSRCALYSIRRPLQPLPRVAKVRQGQDDFLAVSRSRSVVATLLATSPHAASSEAAFF